MLYSKIPFDPTIQICSNPALSGLDVFKSGLEKIFFAGAEVQLAASRNHESQIIVNLRCRLNLDDMIQSQEHWLWGPNNPAIPGKSGIWELLSELRRSNPDVSLDLEEFNLQLDDSLIVIRSIGPNSIAEELACILSRIGQHYPYFNGNRNTAPYEIFIAVSDINIPLPTVAGPARNGAFYDYWAVYYDSEIDPFIYDLRQRHLLQEDLGLGIPG